eukprot:CAMPEP_0174277620 /NCGR_PEP_ID=MMETSP0439-20130205/61031_1 /TAXON_ID=0 /ORGANISM="Stereomyxa ramosa, Strain Chinc5" /LENGTH=544 /DNA_ID=CAMNT_0015369957 /DNA_START=805 /DNA_END=2439 /DNA_ORIENTATION=-
MEEIAAGHGDEGITHKLSDECSSLVHVLSGLVKFVMQKQPCGILQGNGVFPSKMRMKFGGVNKQKRESKGKKKENNIANIFRKLTPRKSEDAEDKDIVIQRAPTLDKEIAFRHVHETPEDSAFLRFTKRFSMSDGAINTNSAKYESANRMNKSHRDRLRAHRNPNFTEKTHDENSPLNTSSRGTVGLFYPLSEGSSRCLNELTGKNIKDLQEEIFKSEASADNKTAEPLQKVSVSETDPEISESKPTTEDAEFEDEGSEEKTNRERSESKEKKNSEKKNSKKKNTPNTEKAGQQHPPSHNGLTSRLIRKRSVTELRGHKVDENDKPARQGFFIRSRSNLVLRARSSQAMRRKSKEFEDAELRKHSLSDLSSKSARNVNPRTRSPLKRTNGIRQLKQQVKELGLHDQLCQNSPPPKPVVNKRLLHVENDDDEVRRDSTTFYQTIQKGVSKMLTADSNESQTNDLDVVPPNCSSPDTKQLTDLLDNSAWMDGTESSDTAIFYSGMKEGAEKMMVDINNSGEFNSQKNVSGEHKVLPKKLTKFLKLN